MQPYFFVKETGNNKDAQVDSDSRAHLKTNTPSANTQQRLIEPHPVSEDNHMCTPEVK